MENQPKWLYAVILIIAIVAVAAYFYWPKQKPAPAQEELSPPVKAGNPAVSGTLPSIAPQTEVVIPETNPVDKANPFKDIYQNPFE